MNRLTAKRIACRSAALILDSALCGMDPPSEQGWTGVTPKDDEKVTDCLREVADELARRGERAPQPFPPGGEGEQCL